MQSNTVDVLDEESGPRPDAEFGLPDRADLRWQRIDDYVQESLAKLDPLEANLGAVNADLLQMAHRFKQGLDDFLAGHPSSPEKLEQVETSLEYYLRLTKQIDRFTQLTIKLRANHPKE